MRTLAILPIKSFDEAKQRLRETLEPAPRRALVEAMYSDVLVALGRSQMIDRLVVVSGDHGAQRIAGGYGAEVLEDEHQGHNAAAAQGIARAVELGAERVLLIPGDCPLLAAAELDGLLSRPFAARSAVIVPDRHGTGTNALLLTPPEALTPAFGPGSRARHEALGHARDLDVSVAELPSLALDVDTPEDLLEVGAALAARHGGAAHTRGMLAQRLRTRSG